MTSSAVRCEAPEVRHRSRRMQRSRRSSGVEQRTGPPQLYPRCIAPFLVPEVTTGRNGSVTTGLLTVPCAEPTRRSSRSQFVVVAGPLQLVWSHSPRHAGLTRRRARISRCREPASARQGGAGSEMDTLHGISHDGGEPQQSGSLAKGAAAARACARAALQCNADTPCTPMYV